jgi:hypothetical protein
LPEFVWRKFGVLFDPKPNFPPAFKDGVHPRVGVECRFACATKLREIAKDRVCGSTFRIKNLFVRDLARRDQTLCAKNRFFN